MTLNSGRSLASVATAPASQIPGFGPLSHAADDADWKRVHANGSTPSYSVYSKPIQKSEQDDREYRIIRLENGVEAVLVHDAKADKAAASMDVAVGHLRDPVSCC